MSHNSNNNNSNDNIIDTDVSINVGRKRPADDDYTANTAGDNDNSGVGHDQQDNDFGTALLVAAMKEGNKTAEDIEKHLHSIVENDMILDTKKVEYLQTMIDAIKHLIKQTTDRDQLVLLSVVQGQITFCIRDLNKKIATTKAAVAPLGRVASITVGLDEKLKYQRDLIEFSEVVKKLFRWFDPDNMEYNYTQYMAPYFPIIQSSGSGKTRLFCALVEVSQKEQSIDYKCVMILLQNSRTDKSDDGDLTEYFYEKFTLTYDIPPNFDEKNVRGQVWTKLNILVEELRGKNSGCEKFVLLFDEAQNWIDNDGFAIRCVRWWLRMSREIKIVAVFAGTTSSLANFYRDTAPIGGYSRDADIQYVNYNPDAVDQTPQKKLYPPFFRLCSIGCYHSDDTENKELSDFHRGAFYGRPLFAHLQKKDGLNFKLEKIVKVNQNNEKKTKIWNSTLHSILLRMVLSETDWKNDSTAVCSILGSRVQMGITTSFVTASNLVSKAYAYLVHFHPDEAGTTKNAVARIAFMPDPVCAALAMGLMDEHWMLDGNDGTRPIRGQAKTFWSAKAMELFKSGLCMPEKGNPGEIMVALYLLFCGDLLRSEKESTLRDFSVSLDKWFSLVKNGKVSAMSTVGAAGASAVTKNPNADVNFIQVCRNYFRGCSWCTKKGLEWMYKSATASYVYPDCPAVDLVAAIRVKADDDYTYHPLLVSVKCHKTFNNAKMQEAMIKMANLLKKVRKKQRGRECPAALCLLVLIGPDIQKQDIPDAGSKDLPQHENPHMTRSKTTENEFAQVPKKPSLQIQDYQKWVSNELDTLGAAGGMDIFRFITVPNDDQFGISDSLRGMTTAYSLTEIFSSHGYAYGEDSLNPEDVLRVEHGNDEKELVESLRYLSGSADDGSDKDES